MARSEEELFAIKERAAAQLMSIPGVTAVGLGGRARAGELIDELVLKVYVAEKRPPEALDPAELVPPEFEGIPTDVEQMPGTGRLLQALRGGSRSCRWPRSTAAAAGR